MAGLSLSDAALAYAEAGWYVLPTDPAVDIKSPGSVVRGRWHEQSSRDAEQIRRWWTSNPDYGIALHCGRSGAVVFDLDVSDLTAVRVFGRPDIADALAGASAIQGTRLEGERGHYMFAMPDGASFGNGAGAFMMWGEVRGKNGVIVAAPTPHPDAETKSGQYRQIRTGTLTQLPAVLRECLTDAGDSADPLSDAELDNFLDTHTGGGCGRDGCRHVANGPATQFRELTANGASRHDTLVKVAPWAFAEAVAGCYSAREAFGTLHRAFIEAFSDDDDPVRRAGLGDEFLRIARWAAALADPARAHRNDNLPTDDDLEAFWSTRPELENLCRFARSRRVAPWAMFGHVLSVAVSAIPPNVVLPPIVGAEASLNLFVALVGKSGSIKSAAMAAAESWLRVCPEPNVKKPGSGEGLAKCYAFIKKPKGEPAQQIGKAWSVLASVAEVDTLNATGGRGGSTLLTELRYAWSGERLGHDYAGEDKAITLMPHRYRLCMTVGVQPLRAGPIFDDKDAGTPQRFLWMPTTDPGAPDIRPVPPEPLTLPQWPADVQNPLVDPDESRCQALGRRVEHESLEVLSVPQDAWDVQDGHTLSKLRDADSVDPLDGHKQLVRLKVAAALMWLNGRIDKVSEQDWELAGVVLAVSDVTRANVQRTLSAQVVERNKSIGRATGAREVEADAVKRQAALRRVAENIYRTVERAGGDVARTKARNKIAQRDRDEYFDEAEAVLIAEGRICKVAYEHNTQRGYRLQLAEGVSNVS
ncbi:bifunctional DNA primase/polymerase [Mycobacteroides abscessus]|uniref:bifunctional DNA primase/polymerase n=1 Tax=Mycobacteroides abscessus TaxID=36809 RepID=UPI0012FFE84A|nr:bifunctional DNA primase/polymerase [Mycobacteroides abscessus]